MILFNSSTPRAPRVPFEPASTLLMTDSVFFHDVIEGLSKPQKQLPCKYFYDERGSQLFIQICRTSEYYITRTELELLEKILPELANMIGDNATIIEYGSGEGKKIRYLLNALHRPQAYIPIDISREMLQKSAFELQKEFPSLTIIPTIADYSEAVKLPAEVLKNTQNKRVVFFPGSTISNFSQEEARDFLHNINSILKPGDGFILGADLVKSATRLHHAYNDKSGITAEFNRNILRRINRELDADFQLDNFEHYAFYNPTHTRIEMHLMSLKQQTVHISDKTFHFRLGETIHTENSYKFSNDVIKHLGATSGFLLKKSWQDPDQLFSLHYFVKF